MTVESPSTSLHLQQIAIFSNDQSHAPDRLAELLSQTLKRSCVARRLDDEEPVDTRPLILVDCSCYTPNRIQSWLGVKHDDSSIPPVALYNSEPSSLHESLLEWPCVRGFFYRATEPSQILDGLQLLLRGDFWVPRRLLHAYLERNRRTPRHTIKTPDLLTRREREIL